jgi:dimethylhistidine N-methyltransferase
MPASAACSTEILEGLTDPRQKRLPCSLLYDAVGSALFEAITHLDEYGLTRADERIILAHAEEIASRMPPGSAVAELGSGSGRKTRAIVDALDTPAYFPIDVSGTALAVCERTLGDLTTVYPVEAEYLEGLARVAAHPLLVLFLGSSIGNFEKAEAVEFLRSVRRVLRAGDALLLGADLIKPEVRLLAAYDDAAGVTAAFDRNILARLNRECGADFELRAWEHEARWNGRASRVEMHLRSTREQTVHVCGQTIRFRAGETIWTESSRKFTPEELPVMAGQTGFAAEAMWIDEEWPFAECFWRVRA